MMAKWLHAIQQFQFSIVFQPGRDHGNAEVFREFPLLQFPVIPFRSLPNKKKIQSASRSGRGLRQVTSTVDRGQGYKPGTEIAVASLE